MLVSMHLGIILLVFGVIFVAELPDKSLLATLILSTRYPAFLVWLGAALAFLVHVIIAVTVGRLLTLLPHKLLEGIIAALFLLGATLVLSGKYGPEGKKDTRLTKQEIHKPLLVFATAFSVVFIGEWGDITQIVTTDYAARYHDPVNVALGAIIGLWTVTAVAVVVGKRALTLVPPKVLQRVTGVVLLGFGLASLFSVIS